MAWAAEVVRMASCVAPVNNASVVLPFCTHRRWGNNGGRKWRGNRGPPASINFVTAHDGFTLADLVRGVLIHRCICVKLLLSYYCYRAIRACGGQGCCSCWRTKSCALDWD